jgi:hypothetical protein
MTAVELHNGSVWNRQLSWGDGSDEGYSEIVSLSGQPISAPTFLVLLLPVRFLLVVRPFEQSERPVLKSTVIKLRFGPDKFQRLNRFIQRWLSLRN